ncbi:hypothetical protein REPUB_Repub16aG0154700 [Reevesia pubescens]
MIQEEAMTQTLYGDSVRLQQVLADFLLISVNFSPHGGQLVVELDQRSTWTVCSSCTAGAQLGDMAETFIQEGKAYVDDMPHEEMEKERMDGIKSKCRNNSVEENLKLWKEIIAGFERGLQC